MEYLPMVSNTDRQGGRLPRDAIASLPLDVVYCLFEAFDPSAILGLALTNKVNLALLATWHDKKRSLNSANGDEDIAIGTQFKYLCRVLGQVKDRKARKQAAMILRRWQARVLTEQGQLCQEELADWNVCNGCLRFKKQHAVSCTQCQGPTCENFICHRYCIFY